MPIFDDIPAQDLSFLGGAAPEPEKKSRPAWAVANDLVIEGANAAVGSVKTIADFIDPSSRASKAMDDFMKMGEERQSDVVKEAKRKFQDEIAAAGGFTDEAIAAGRYVLENPGLAAAYLAGNFAPPGLAVFGAGKLAGGIAAGRAAARGLSAAEIAARAGQTGMRAGQVTGATMGAAMSGGDAAQQTYQDLTDPARRDVVLASPEAQALLAQGMAEDQVIEAIATQQARKASVAPAALGGVFGATGLERVLAGGHGRGRLATGAIEALQGATEETLTGISGNLATKQIDPSVDPMKGAGVNAVLGAVYEGVPGVAFGGRREPEEPVAPPGPPPGPLTRSAEIAAGVQAGADAAAGMSEGGPPPAGAGTQAPTEPTEPPGSGPSAAQAEQPAPSVRAAGLSDTALDRLDEQAAADLKAQRKRTPAAVSAESPRAVVWSEPRSRELPPAFEPDRGTPGAIFEDLDASMQADRAAAPRLRQAARMQTGDMTPVASGPVRGGTIDGEGLIRVVDEAKAEAPEYSTHTDRARRAFERAPMLTLRVLRDDRIDHAEEAQILDAIIRGRNARGTWQKLAAEAAARQGTARSAPAGLLPAPGRPARENAQAAQEGLTEKPLTGNSSSEDAGSPASAQPDAGPRLRIEPVSERAFIVVGDTKANKDRLKAAGGRWNSSRQGWIFPKSREAQVRAALGELLGGGDERTDTPVPGDRVRASGDNAAGDGADRAADARGAGGRRGDAGEPAERAESGGTVPDREPGQDAELTGRKAVAARNGRTREQAAKDRKRAYREANPFRAFLGEFGVHTSERSDAGGDPRRPVMVPYHGALFRNSGMHLDELARRAVEAGFLTQADIDSEFDNGGVNKLADMIRRELAGERIMPIAQTEDTEEARWREQSESYWEAMNEAEDAVAALTDDEINALLQIASDEDAEVSNEEIDLALEPGDAQEGGAGAQEGAAGSEAGGDSAGGAAARDQGSAEVGFGLTAPTPDQFRREAADAEAQARREGAPPPEDFTLTGSNRTVDQTAARGQMELAPAPQPEAASASKEAGATAPKRKGTKAQREAEAAEAARADYFTPGNIVRGYGGFDRVLKYKAPEKPGGGWSVKVEAVRKDGDAWVAEGRPQDARWHSTQPDARELAKGPVERGKAATQDLAEASAKRTRPKGRIEFDSPVVGPSGAKLTDYQWAWQYEESVDERGEDRIRRISDWDKAEENQQTGRMIVHQFGVEMPDGTGQVVSAETALQLLGFTDIQGKSQFKSVESAAKTLARTQMGLAGAEQESARWKADWDAVQKMTPPEPESDSQRPTPGGRGLWWSMGDASIRQITDGPLTQSAREGLVSQWRDNRMVEKGWKPGDGQKLADTVSDFKKRIKVAEKRIQAITKAASTEHDIPAFETYDDALDWVNKQAEPFASRKQFEATNLYRAAYPQIKALYDRMQARSAAAQMQTMTDAGIKVGDRVQFTVPGFLLAAGRTYTGTVIDSGGRPVVKIDGRMEFASRGGRTESRAQVAWDSRWTKVAPANEKGPSQSDLLTDATEFITELNASRNPAKTADEAYQRYRNNNAVAISRGEPVLDERSFRDAWEQLRDARDRLDATSARVTRDSDLADGTTIYDEQGKPYRVHYQRNDLVVAHPIVDGKAQVSADTSVRFWVNPDRPASGENDRTDPIYTAPPGTLVSRANAALKGKIEDVGEKIGGARKDLSTPTGRRAAKAEDEAPGWRKRYEVSQITKSTKPAEEGRWVIYDKRQKDRLGQPKQVGRDTFPTKEAAEAAIPLAEVARNHRVTLASTKKGAPDAYEITRMVTDRKRVKVVDLQFATRADAMRYMVEHAVEIIETKTSFGEEILPAPDTVKRTGPVRRQGDATAEQFKDTFGFRAVEFGNWNSQEERQEVMNHAFDGLADLAEVLGIPTRAIGLNGELALAFGARGSGLTGARAHYEPDYSVINLTKMRGAGSLAHEWLHALDHYLGRQDGKASSERVKNNRGDTVFKTHSPEGDMASHGFKYRDSGVRPEVREAYAALIETMYRKAEQFVEDTQAADRFVGKAREDVQKHLGRIRENLATKITYRTRKNAPASAEQLAAFDEIARKIVDGEAIETTVMPAGKSGVRWSNDALEALSRIIKDVRGHSGFLATRDGTLDRLRAEMEHYSQRLKMLAQAQSAEVKTKKVPTDYAMAAKSIDQGRASDYWATQHEMAARAFQSYVLDKIAERGNTSDFLTYGAENLVVPTPWGWQRPFPAGDERKAINAAFDKLVATLQTRETDKGVMLFSRGRGTTGQPVAAVTKTADAVRAAWANGPEVVVLGSIDEAPADVRALDSASRSKGAGRTEGFWHSGKVYLVADALPTAADVVRVLAHETLGHYGLRGVFGDRLGAILAQIVRARPADVAAKLRDYGIASTAENRLVAAEEVLAEMAQNRPELGFVRRAIAAIRNWLRGLGLNLRMSAGDIIANYILPARQFVERGERGRAGGAAARSGGAPIFYSELERQIDAINARAQPAQSWAQQIDSLTKKGVKPDEIEWSGVKEWLALQQGKVTKDAILEYLAGNGVRVEETILGDPETEDALLEREARRLMREDGIENPTDEQVAEFIEEHGYDIDNVRDWQFAGQTKFGTYRVPGRAENYRELLLTLPQKVIEPDAANNARIAEGRKAVFDHYEPQIADLDRRIDVARDAGSRGEYNRLWEQRNSLIDERDATAARKAGVIQKSRIEPVKFQSNHWNQPNVLAHVRIDERTDADGKRVLFVNEMQSDWGQRGRKHGFKTADRLIDGHDYDWWSREADRRMSAKPFDREAAMRAAENRNALAGKPDEVARGPFVEKTDAWVALALKRIIRYAVDNGFDRVAIASGEQAAKMFNLSEHVTRLYYDRDGRGYILSADGRRGEVFPRDMQYSDEELDGVVGKEIAQKIRNREGREDDENGGMILEGVDLEVGGEGMEKFYPRSDLGPVGTDKNGKPIYPIVQLVAQKVLKQLGGPALTTVDIYTPARAPGAVNEQGIVIGPDGERSRMAEQPGFDITPALRERAARGMPMFSRPDAFKRWFAGSKVVDAEGKPLVVYHGSVRDVSIFDPGASPWGNKGLYFTSDPLYASVYATNGRGREGPGAVYPVYLAIKNPLVLMDGRLDGESRIGHIARAINARVRAGGLREKLGGGQYISDTDASALRAAGYDGVIADHGSVFIALDPAQVKSATGNRGTFDSANPDIRFSRAMPTRQDISNHIADLLQSSKGFNWWHRTIGTQYEKAQRSPLFRRVFDAAQDFLNAVSDFGNRAADEAPTLLPKMEGLRDVLKKPASKKDLAAIARPIFDGTLADTDPAKGVVWTDAQLRSDYGLNDRQIGLYREFRAAADKSLDDMGKTDLLRYVGNDARAVRQRVIDSPDIQAAANLIAARLNEIAEREPHRADALHATVETVMEKATRIGELKAGGYAPLMRFGRFSVYVTRQTEDGPEQVYFGMFETQREANRVARQFREDPEFADADVGQGVMSQEAFKLFQGVSPETLELFADVAGVEQTELFQAYLKLARSNRSAMKRLIHRKGVAGFSEDVTRVLASFITSNARAGAANLYTGDMNTAASEIPKEQGDVKDEAVRLVEFVRGTNDPSSKLRSILFMQYLGGSVASALVNMTQPITMTYPYLAQFTGAAKAGTVLTKAIRDAVTGVGSDADLSAAIRRAEREGIVSPQEIHHLYSEAGIGLGRQSWVRRATFLWGSLFSAAEQFNRRSTFIAAYRIAREQGNRNAFAFAERAVVETQGIYSRANRPNWARNPVGATVLTFKQFSIAYLEFLKRLPPKQQALALVVLALAAGLDEFPFADDLDDVIDTIAQAMGYNWSTKRAKREWLAGALGKDGAEFVLRGASAIPGVPINISARLGLGNLVPGTGMLLGSTTDKTREVTEVLGAAGSFAQSVANAGAAALRGDMGSAAQEVVPLAVRNALKGIDMYQTGMYRDSKGRRVLDVDAYDAMVKAIGFQPAEVASAQERAGLVQQSVALVRNVESRIAERMARARFEGDMEALKQARAELREWNRKNPEARIAINESQITRRVRAMRSTRAERLEKASPKEIRRTVRESV